jgi:hypothetical protein
MLAEATSGEIPRDFRVVAIFVAGVGNAPAGDGITAITVTITADGKTVLKSAGYFGPNHRVATRVQTSHLATARVDEIVAVTQRARFFSLPGYSLDGAEDSLGYVLTITANGRTHRVDVTPPFERIRELRRFRAVWTSVMRAVPSPLGRVASHHLEKYI